ncbi:CHRD domain-containing protein [Nonomuraea monospora]|uniref:CHRD domain-containing protein n=1 Tax=Nonomuraea monospora TaxID=568818 RepID=UPI0031D5D499
MWPLSGSASRATVSTTLCGPPRPVGPPPFSSPGKTGVNGPVVIDLLSNGDLRGNFASGSVRVKSSLLRDIKAKRKNWYINLHTGEFPDGAVRGQLDSASHS